MFHVSTPLLGVLDIFRVILNAKTVLFSIYQVYGKVSTFKIIWRILHESIFLTFCKERTPHDHLSKKVEK